MFLYGSKHGQEFLRLCSYPKTNVCIAKDGQFDLSLIISTLCGLINAPPSLINFWKFFPPPLILFRPPFYWLSPISISAPVKFSNINYRLKVFPLISVCERYILVEINKISLRVGINSTKV